MLPGTLEEKGQKLLCSLELKTSFPEILSQSTSQVGVIQFTIETQELRGEFTARFGLPA
jgi:hypothetical protein